MDIILNLVNKHNYSKQHSALSEIIIDDSVAECAWF